MILTERQTINFWNKVLKTPTCWLWTGSKTWKGYGQLGLNHFSHRAHKVSWQVANNVTLKRNQWILHKCDVRNCVRPEHLYLGTPSDNIRDAIQRGRIRKGSDHPHAKLTETDVHLIKILIAKGKSMQTIGPAFGVSHQSIREIAQGTHWKHI